MKLIYKIAVIVLGLLFVMEWVLLYLDFKAGNTNNMIIDAAVAFVDCIGCWAFIFTGKQG